MTLKEYLHIDRNYFSIPAKSTGQSLITSSGAAKYHRAISFSKAWNILMKFVGVIPYFDEVSSDLRGESRSFHAPGAGIQVPLVQFLKLDLHMKPNPCHWHRYDSWNFARYNYKKDRTYKTFPYKKLHKTSR